MATSKRTTSGSILAPLGPSRSADLPLWANHATGLAEVVELSRSALSSIRATHAASEAASGWPGGCAGDERSVGADLGRSMAPTGDAATRVGPAFRSVTAGPAPGGRTSLEPPGRL